MPQPPTPPPPSPVLKSDPCSVTHWLDVLGPESEPLWAPFLKYDHTYPADRGSVKWEITNHSASGLTHRRGSNITSSALLLGWRQSSPSASGTGKRLADPDAVSQP